MDVLEAIRTRRSIRQYEPRPVPDDLVHKVLAAGMAAPSARNSQPWHFVVVRDPALLAQVPRINPNAEMAGRAPLAILVCADPGLEISPGYWPVDCAAATENMLLAAHGLGLGAVWTGIYPREDRMAGYRGLLGIPDRVVPHSLVVLGYAAERRPAEDRYRPDRVHENRW